MFLIYLPKFIKRDTMNEAAKIMQDYSLFIVTEKAPPTLEINRRNYK